MDYSSEVLRRFGRGTERRTASGASACVVGEAEDRTLGVWVKLELAVADVRILGAAYEVYGCPHTVAAADWVAEWLRGKPLDAVDKLDIRAVAATLDVPAQKLGKLLRIEDALIACMQQLNGDINERNQ